jgi:acetoin:2,6-dichlorophenolindophenol oxidoreductase subunit beta
VTQPADSITMLQAVNLALRDAMAEDANVIVFGEDVADKEGGGVVLATKGLSSEFGEARVRSTPIAEQAIIGAAIGASMVGMRPVAEIMLMNFTTVAMDMIVNHAAKLRFMSGGQTSVPITIRTMTGAGFSNGGQHSDFLEAWFAHTAGLKVVIPSSPADAYGLLRSCIDDPDPCIFVESLALYRTPGSSPVRGSRVPLGVAKVLREGRDVSVITYGPQVPVVMGVAEALKSEIDIEVIDLRTVSPFDEAAVVESVRKTRRAVVVHEAVKNFGVGAEIGSRLSESLFDLLKAPVQRVGAAYSPVPFSKPLEAAFIPNAATIERAVRKTLEVRVASQAAE